MRAETPQFYIEAKEIQARRRTQPPDGLIRAGAAAGSGIGFCGAVLYLACWLLFQLGVGSADGTHPALLPSTAQWVTAMLLFLAFGLVGSILLGALSGTVTAALIRVGWSSQNPVLAWLFGTVIAFVIMVLITILLNAYGIDLDLADRLRELTLPSMMFVIEGGLVGLWIYRDGLRRPGCRHDHRDADGDAPPEPQEPSSSARSAPAQESGERGSPEHGQGPAKPGGQ